MPQNGLTGRLREPRHGISPAGGDCPPAGLLAVRSCSILRTKNWAGPGPRGSTGSARDLIECGDAQECGRFVASLLPLDLRNLFFCDSEADAELLHITDPSLAFGFSDSIVEVVSDLFDSGLSVGPTMRTGHRTQACSWMQSVPYARPQSPSASFLRSKWLRNSSHSSGVTARYSSVGLVWRRRAMKARCASMASAG